jgi:hypothetical protein
MTKKKTKKALQVSAKEARAKLTQNEIDLIDQHDKWTNSENYPTKLKYDEDKNTYKVPENTGNLDVDSDLFIAKLSKQYSVHDQYAVVELLNQLTDVARQSGRTEDRVNAAIALVAEIQPKDPIEAMLVNQMVSIHMLVMDSARFASLKNQSFEATTLYLREVNKLTRTFTAQMDALNKHRGKGQQKMIVEHIHVNEGGQAVIGNIDGSKKLSSQPGG